jgi:hypothetical protein
VAGAGVMIKTIDLPGSLYDRCVLQDVYSEVSIMERFRGGCSGVVVWAGEVKL